MKNLIQELSIGSTIDNQRLCKIFGCSPQGGMRRSHKTNTLVLISDRTKMYEDREHNGIYHYTGMGQKGDQELKSQNKTLAESKDNGISVHFFEVMKKGQYTYRGEVELAADPYIDHQKDVDGRLRNVWVFPLKKVGNESITDSWIDEIEILEMKLKNDIQITNTEKERIIKSRIGQSVFKKKLIDRECKCAICGVTDVNFLIASHIKPWSKSSNIERLDVHNGLLLCPNHDALFDKGYISFDENGVLMISSKLSNTTKMFMNVTDSFRIKVTSEMKKYLSWHYNNQFLK